MVHPTSFVHPLAAVTGHVIIGKDCYIGPGAAIRGDWGEIVIEDGVNVQENCTVHMFPGKKILFKEGAHVGHGAVIHGANLGPGLAAPGHRATVVGFLAGTAGQGQNTDQGAGDSHGCFLVMRVF